MPKPYSHHLRKLVSLGIPIIIGQIGIIVLGIADTMMIGRYSTEALAASSFVNNLFNLVLIASTGFSYGLTPIIGELFGANRKPAIGAMLKNALLANLSAAIVMSVVMVMLYFNIDLLNQPQELLPLIRPYYLVILASLVFALLFNALKQFSDGIMDTHTSMWILLFGNGLNIALNFLLIYGCAGLPELGLLGAGIATLLSRIVMLLLFVALFFLHPRYSAYRAGFFASAINWPDFKKLNAIGWPLALQMGMETASFSLTTVMVGWLSTTALAAHQIMLTIGTFFFMLYYGMGAASSIRVSFFVGENRPTDIRRAAFSGFALILAIAALLLPAFWILRNEVVLCFTDNAAVLSTAGGLFGILMLYQFGDSLQIAFANALRGIMDVKIMMLISFFAYFVISLPASYLFGFTLNLGIAGVWLGFPLGLTCAGLLFWLRFLYKTKLPAAS